MDVQICPTRLRHPGAGRADPARHTPFQPLSASPLSIRPRDLLRIAVPISLGSLVQFFVVLTDNFFLSRAGDLELNAAGNAALVYLTFIMVLTGGSMGIQILVARHQGAREWERMALASRTGRVALVSLGAVLTALVLGINTWGGWEPVSYTHLTLPTT